MARRTISVNVTGENDVREMSDKISKLKKEVLSLKKELEAGFSKNSALSFKVTLDTSDFVKEFNKIKSLVKGNKEISIKASDSSYGNLTKETNKVKSSINEAKKATDGYSVSLNKLGDVNGIKELQSDFKQLEKTGTTAIDRLKNSQKEFLKEASKAPEMGKTANQLQAFARRYDEIVRGIGTTRGKAGQSGYFKNPITGVVEGLSRTDSGNISYDHTAMKTLARELMENSLLTEDLKKDLMSAYDILNKFARVNLNTGINGLTDYLNAIEEIQNALNGANRILIGFINNSVRLGAINPFKAYTSAFSATTRQLIGMNRNLATSMGSMLRSSLSSAFSNIRMLASRAFSSIRQETVEIGDAMTTYQRNMNELGVSRQEIDRSMFDLSQYGRKSVFNIADLLDMTGSYRAFGLDNKQAVDLTKAMAGLTAGRSDSTQGISSANRQLTQMLSRGYANAQDLNIMKEWFNSVGVARVNQALDTLAKSKGYANSQDAVRQRALSTEELIGVLKGVGLDKGMQALVTTPVTPGQSLENLRESIAQTLAFRQYKTDANGNLVTDENGNAVFEEGALGKLYTSTAKAIQGITNIVDSRRFQSGVRQFGNDVSAIIDSSVDLGTRLSNEFGDKFVSSLSNLYTTVTKFSNFGGAENNLKAIVESLIDFNRNVAVPLSRQLPNVVNSGLQFVNMVTNLGSALIVAGAGNAVSSLIDFYTTLGNLATTSGAVDTAVKAVKGFWDTLNSILKDVENQTALKSAIDSLDGFITELYNVIGKLGTNTNLVPTALGVLESLFDSFESLLRKIDSKVNPKDINSFLSNFKTAFDTLLSGLTDVYANIASSVIKAGASEQGKKFFEAVGNFILTVNLAIQNALTEFGGGSTEAGVERLLKWVTNIINGLASIAEVIGQSPIATMATIGIIAFGNKALELVKVLSSVSSAIKTFLGTGGSESSMLGKLGGFLRGTADNTGLLPGIANSVGSKFYQAKASRQLAKGNLAQASIYDDIAKSMGMSGFGTTKLGAGIKHLTSSVALANKAFANTKVQTGSFIKSAKSWGSSLKAGVPALSKFGKVATGVASLGTSIVANVGNSFVQNSGASRNVKRASNMATEALNYGTLGATIGSFIPIPGIGTIVGGTVGTAYGAFKGYRESKDNEKQAKQAKKEAEKQAKAEEQQYIKAMVEDYKAQVDAMAQQSSELRTSFFKSINENTSQEEALSASVAYVNALSQQNGQSLTATLKSLGANYSEIPAGIEDSFVTLGDQLVSFKDLMAQTGMTSEELFGALQLTANAKGEYELQLKNSAGEVTGVYQAMTDEEKARQTSVIEDTKAKLIELGMSAESVKDLTYQNIQQFSDNLKEALNGANFATENDQKEQLATILANGDENLKNQYMQRSLENLRQLANDTLGVTSEATKTTPEKHDELKKKYADLLGKAENLSKDEVAKRIEESAQASVGELEQMIAQQEYANDEASGKHKKAKKKASKDSERLAFIQSSMEAIDAILNNGLGGKMADYQKDIEYAVASMQQTADDGQKQFGADHLTQIMNSLGIIDTQLQQSIIDNIQNKGMTFQQALAEAQANQDPALEENLKSSVQTYFNDIMKLYEDGVISIDQAKEALAGVDISGIDTSGVGSEGQKLLTEVDSTNTKTTNKIKDMKKGAEADFSSVDTSSISGVVSSIGTALSNLASNVWSKTKEIYNSVTNSNNNPAVKKGGFNTKSTKRSGELAFRSNGGLIPLYRQYGDMIPEYHSYGNLAGVNWRSKGTDTVPAMLTPGEFVLRKKAVDSVGVGLLRSINTHGLRALQNTSNSTIINNVYNNNNAKLTQNVDNKSQYLNGMRGLDRLMRYV